MENLNLNETAIFYLHTIRRWAKIISIIMFVMIGMLLLMGIIMSYAMNTIASEIPQLPMGFPVGAIALMYVFIAVIYFFPVYYLYKFSQHLEFALNARSEQELTVALQFLKNHYTIVGVLMIIGIIMMALAFIIAFFAAAIGIGAAAGGGEFL